MGPKIDRGSKEMIGPGKELSYLLMGCRGNGWHTNGRGTRAIDGANRIS